MGHYVYSFATRQPDVLIGLLSQFPFDAFEEHSNSVDAWLNEEQDINEVEESLSSLDGFYSGMEKRHVPDQNWNATWESRFEPVAVDDFCRIRAEFHSFEDGYEHEIVIAPKQAFGTGHHETTYMMIDAMRNLDFSGKAVLDLGCGTGVLAILAAKLGAEKVVGIDIEEEAIENSIENAQLNEVHFDTRLGSVEAVAGLEFDFVLANINRNAIMFLMADIVDLITPGGDVYFSGFLEFNQREIEEKASSLGLSLISRNQKGEWLCLGFTKSSS